MSGASNHIQDLSDDPARFRRTKQHDGISEVGRHAEFPQGVHPLWCQLRMEFCTASGRVFNTLSSVYPGADGVHGELPRSQGHGEVTAQNFQRRLGRTHGHPQLPTSGADAGHAPPIEGKKI